MINYFLFLKLVAYINFFVVKYEQFRIEYTRKLRTMWLEERKKEKQIV